MRSRHSIGLAIASLAIALALPKFLSAQAPQTAAAPRTADVSSQGLDPATLLKPPVDSWPTYHGDYSGQRHSKLTQITPDNVHQLTLAWAWQSGLGGGIKSTPILVERGALHHGPRQHLGDRRADGAPDLALHVSEHQPRLSHRSPRRGRLQGHGFPDDAGCTPDRARRERRQGQVERRDCRLEEGLLVDERPARHQESPDRRRVGRLRQSARHAQVVRPRDRESRSGRSTARHRSARLVRSAATPLAARCGTPARTIPI